MPSAFAQTMPPAEHFNQSRLTVTIVALIAVACVLAAVFIYLQSGQNVQQPKVVDQRVQEINQALAALKGAVPATQAEIQSALKQLSSSKIKPASQSQIDQALSQLKAQ